MLTIELDGDMNKVTKLEEHIKQKEIEALKEVAWLFRDAIQSCETNWFPILIQPIFEKFPVGSRGYGQTMTVSTASNKSTEGYN